MARRGWILGTVVATLLAGPAGAQQDIGVLPEQARLVPEEEFTIRTLPEPSPHWVYVLDVAFDNLVASRVNIFDADTGDFVGVLHSGYVPNVLLAPDRSAVYIVETYWSHGTRGKREDLVTVFDSRTLEAEAEIVLPKGRALVVSKQPVAALSDDARFLLSFNLSPATSVSLVDLGAQRYVGEIESPGCSLVYPTGDRSFSMLCPDGSLVDVSFREDGSATTADNEPFFDSETDPVFEHAARDSASRAWFFVSYDGRLYEVAYDEKGRTKPVDSWSIVGKAEAEEGWRPGGWQLVGWHDGLKRLFVLMHKGPKWSHKWPGEEVWVIDPATNGVERRIALEEPSLSLFLTRDADPLLVTLTETGVLGVYDPQTGEHLRSVEGVGVTPFLLDGFRP